MPTQKEIPVVKFPNFEITPISIKTPIEEIFYYEIWKIQVNNVNLDNPQIILFWQRNKIILEYYEHYMYTKHLNYILESIAED